MFPLHRSDPLPVGRPVHHLQHRTVFPRGGSEVCERRTHHRGGEIHGGARRRGPDGEWTFLLPVADGRDPGASRRKTDQNVDLITRYLLNICDKVNILVQRHQLKCLYFALPHGGDVCFL